MADGSAHVACCGVTKTIAVAYGKDVIVNRFDDQLQSVAFTKWSTGTEFNVCAIAFMPPLHKLADPMLVISDEGKRVLLYSPMTEAKVLSIYPATKKVQILHPLTPDSILMADKFGDVYLHRIQGRNTDSPSWVDGEPQFVLQHLSIFTALAIVPAAGTSAARVISCDRDDHVRVSRYPDTFYIDNYLWGPAPQTPVVSIAVATQSDCSSYVLLGTATGRVAIWRLKPTNIQPAVETETQPNLEELVVVHDATEKGCVVGAVHLVSSEDSRADGFVVAYEQSDNLCFFSIPALAAKSPAKATIDVVSGDTIAVSSTRLQFGGLPLALEAFQSRHASSNRAVILQRDGTMSWVTLVVGARNSAEIHVSAISNNNMAIQLQEWRAALETVDVKATWNTSISDPRSRKAGGDGSDDDDDEQPEAGKKRKRSPPSAL